MSDAVAAALILVSPLFAISFGIWNIARILRCGEVTIRNYITVTIRHPKSIETEIHIKEKVQDKQGESKHE